MKIHYEGVSKIFKKICEAINNKPDLGETAETAYYGDKGKEAYEHSLNTTSNPHHITAETIGLENVDNTSDLDKPISIATQRLFDSFGLYVSSDGYVCQTIKDEEDEQS